MTPTMQKKPRSSHFFFPFGVLVSGYENHGWKATARYALFILISIFLVILNISAEGVKR
jgi:hypothetical protein